MSIIRKKQVEETVEINTPLYSKDDCWFYYVSEAGLITYVSQRTIGFFDASQNAFYQGELNKALSGTPCTKEEFEKAFNDTQVKLEIAAGIVQF